MSMNNELCTVCNQKHAVVFNVSFLKSYPIENLCKECQARSNRILQSHNDNSLNNNRLPDNNI